MKGAPKPPTWDDIQSLIQRVDQVCRESEMLRAQAEQSMRRRHAWPERPDSPRRHDTAPSEDDGSREGSDGTL